MKFSLISSFDDHVPRDPLEPRHMSMLTTFSTRSFVSEIRRFNVLAPSRLIRDYSSLTSTLTLGLSEPSSPYREIPFIKINQTLT